MKTTRWGWINGFSYPNKPDLRKLWTSKMNRFEQILNDYCAIFENEVIILFSPIRPKSYLKVEASVHWALRLPFLHEYQRVFFSYSRITISFEINSIYVWLGEQLFDKSEYLSYIFCVHPSYKCWLSCIKSLSDNRVRKESFSFAQRKYYIKVQEKTD